MDPLLFGTAGAFGLASAAGLNTTLPLLIVGLAARFGLLTLAVPYDALASDLALGGLALLALIEIVGDKVPALDSVVQAVQWPLAMAAGAILFASQQSIVQDVSPALAILVGLLTAGGVHALRATIRPAVNLGTLGMGGPVVSAVEDGLALVLTILALLAPVLALVVGAALAIAGARVAMRVLRRRRSADPAR
jgi:hypothetical protein